MKHHWIILALILLFQSDNFISIDEQRINFDKQRIEISFNENLDKNFVKDLSTKLFDWTNQRWIITFSKKNGEPTKKQINQLNKSKLLLEVKKSETYKKMIEIFPDAELIDIETKEEN